MVVTAVLVVTLGRIGDIFGRVRMYNAGFAIFTVASYRRLALMPFSGPPAPASSSASGSSREWAGPC